MTPTLGIPQHFYHDRVISTKIDSETRGLDVVEEVSSGRLGERVRGLRRERGLTLVLLAQRSGVSRAMISKLERGEKNPTLVVAAKVAEGLGGEPIAARRDRGEEGGRRGAPGAA